MAQHYKAVYFSDFPADTAKQKSLTLAFGTKTKELYTDVRDLSSAELRQLLGTDSYENIITAAQNEDLPLNTYCLRQLKQSLQQIKEHQLQLSLAGMDNQPPLFDPVTVTFKGGAKEPFVRWYPYLQGYSPQFVEAILDKYAPDSKCILDPFSGTGTTIFTASQLNKKSYFCEINPVLQFITLTKIQVRQLSTADRWKLADELLEAKQALKALDEFPADYRLHNFYQQTFGNSQFFEDEVYEQVLKLRTWLDERALEKPLVSDLITIAILSALVPASRMKRAGDLRYKTAKEAQQPTPSLLEAISQNLLQMSRDIQDDVNGLQAEPLLITESIHSLAHIPYLEIDTVVTSPPYVNGTNYFRNTKIELWFLRCLTEKNDLTKFRAEALTAGINDVTVAKATVENHPEVEKVVSILEEHAYDSRIPRMIASYFSEITNAFQGIRQHLVNEATVAIDIGDSCYAGVHVPVDKLLSACLQDLGFVQQDSIHLRQRRSKGGMLLHQSLLVFKYRPQLPPFYIKNFISPWNVRWQLFKETLPHQQNPFTKRNWGHPLHSLCSYPGKLKPAIAHHLVKIFVPENGIVLDPFAGSGTVPFEAALQGKISYGFELNPAAFAIANGKIQPPTEKNCNFLIQTLENFIEKNTPTEQELKDAQEFGFNGKLIEYYDTKTLDEILLARRYFQIDPPSKPEEFFVMASLLHILHGNRPYALSRRSHPITPYKPSGPYEYRSLIERLKAKVQRGLQQSLPQEFQPGKMFLQDATSWWPREIDQLDVIITSPPFFDSTRYYLANWLRLWFAGWSPRDFKGRPLGFVDERQKKSFDVYVPILRQARERLKPDGVVVLHLGKSSKCDMASELVSLGKKWFRSADIFDESVAHCESHGIRDKGTVTSHQYLVLY
jgi:DNA modification methylase